ncbi:hypothetical protein PMAYCL1PPCAC_20574, partial [Pristionchus mayeri]
RDRFTRLLKHGPRMRGSAYFNTGIDKKCADPSARNDSYQHSGSCWKACTLPIFTHFWHHLPGNIYLSALRARAACRLK